MKRGLCLVTDSDGHWFMIPDYQREGWEKYLVDLENYEADFQDAFDQNLDLTEIVEPDFPYWAASIDSPHNIVIYDYEQL